jgi:hypothetical protein
VPKVLELARVVMVVEEGSVHFGDIEVVSVSDRCWLQPTAFDPLSDSQNRNSAALNVGLVE